MVFEMSLLEVIALAKKDNHVAVEAAKKLIVRWTPERFSLGDYQDAGVLSKY
ncbi:hypothetical protein HYU17_04980 [Candidatus Woesearchaeota archaeon]|nr:hypothetical protein [Candidatus Woesearchaeota archaeon]